MYWKCSFILLLKHFLTCGSAGHLGEARQATGPWQSCLGLACAVADGSCYAVIGLPGKYFVYVCLIVFPVCMQVGDLYNHILWYMKSLYFSSTWCLTLLTLLGLTLHWEGVVPAGCCLCPHPLSCESGLILTTTQFFTLFSFLWVFFLCLSLHITGIYDLFQTKLVFKTLQSSWCWLFL